MEKEVIAIPKLKPKSLTSKTQNYIWVIIDKKDKLAYYHGLSVANYVKKDYRLSSFKFKIKLVIMEEIFSDEFLECHKSYLQNFPIEKIIRLDFLSKLHNGAFIFGLGNERVLYGISAIGNTNDQVFCYFGATKPIEFDKEKTDCDLFSIFTTSLQEADLDDNNIIPISPNAVFLHNFKTTKLTSVVPEQNYIFVILPHLTEKKKDELYEAYYSKNITHLTFGFINLIEAIKSCYNSDKKIVIMSDLIENDDYEIEISIKGLLSKALESRIKIKFLYHDYSENENKIPPAIEHLYINASDKIIISKEDYSNIANCVQHGVLSENIIYYEHILGKDKLFSNSFGTLNEQEIQQLFTLSHFNEMEIQLLKIYKSETIHITNVAEYIADVIVEYYTEDPANRDAQNEQEEEEVEIEETEIEEEEEVEEEIEEEIEEEEEVELEEDIESKSEIEIFNPEEKFEDTPDLSDGDSFIDIEDSNMEEIEHEDVHIEDIQDQTENLDVEDEKEIEEFEPDFDFEEEENKNKKDNENENKKEENPPEFEKELKDVSPKKEGASR